MSGRRGCAGKLEWPELVGKDGEAAAAVIESENKYVKAIIILKGTIVTKDYNCDRVWVVVDESKVVIKTPKVG